MPTTRIIQQMLFNWGIQDCVYVGWTLIQQPPAENVHQISHSYITTTLPQLQASLLLHWNNADTPNLFIGSPQLFRRTSCTSSQVTVFEYPLTQQLLCGYSDFLPEQEYHSNSERLKERKVNTRAWTSEDTEVLKSNFIYPNKASSSLWGILLVSIHFRNSKLINALHFFLKENPFVFFIVGLLKRSHNWWITTCFYLFNLNFIGIK